MSTSQTAILSASTYDRQACTIGVVHIGMGAFHRAHQAFFFDKYMDKTGDLNWGIAAVNLRAGDHDQFVAASNGGQGYVLKSMAPDGHTDFAHIRSHIGFADWHTEREKAEDFLSLESVKIVTMTVTESGYSLNEDGELDPDDPAIAAEIAGGEPTTIYGYLRIGLARRAQAGGGPLTILCCDNLHQNGARLRRNFGKYLAHCNDHNLIGWIKKNASFPCSMVDRITPKPTGKDSAQVRALFQRDNDPTVRTEDFVQWVVEDNFVAERPEFELVGVEIVEDVAPFEDTKILVLNGGHTCLTYLAALKGYQTFDQAMGDAALYDHFLQYEMSEVLPTLSKVLPFDPPRYLETVTSRFRNANIADSVARICMDGVSKFPIYILPTIEKTFADGRVPLFGLRSIASWFVFAKRAAFDQIGVEYIDPRQEILQPFFEFGGEEGFSKSSILWGNLPKQYPAFSSGLVEQIAEIESQFELALDVKNAI